MIVTSRAALWALLLCGALGAQSLDQRQASVGMRARIEQLVLPGTELRSKPIDTASPIVLRVLATWPHGELHRYDLEYVGLEPGTFDLARFLERVDGASSDDLPKIEVEIVPVLPIGQDVPNALTPGAVPALGGYRSLLIAAGIVWVAGLAAILFVGRRSRRAQSGGSVATRPYTLADRLRPRVEAAVAGTLDAAGKAELERILVEHWRRRLGLEDRKVGDALAEMRQHPEAGALLRALEEWLHRPTPPAEVDVAALLQPYRDVPAEGVP